MLQGAARHSDRAAQPRNKCASEVEHHEENTHRIRGPGCGPVDWVCGDGRTRRNHRQAGRHQRRAQGRHHCGPHQDAGDLRPRARPARGDRCAHDAGARSRSRGDPIAAVRRLREHRCRAQRRTAECPAGDRLRCGRHQYLEPRRDQCHQLRGRGSHDRTGRQRHLRCRARHRPAQQLARVLPGERIATQYARAYGGGGGNLGWVSEQPNKWQQDQDSHGTHVTSTIIGYRYCSVRRA